MNKKFALIGAAGYIAPRHMKAISDTGNDLLAAFDPNDSVGIMDTYFPEAAFFTEFERFDRHVEKLKRSGKKVDFISMCSPNYLHDAHIRFALRSGANAICEKPIVLNPWNIDALQQMEKETGQKIYTILQLRLLNNILALKKQVDTSPANKIFNVDLTYLTARGNWYYTSWKGDISKSGGIATNIGVHFFDILAWIFGNVRMNVVHLHTHDRAAGYLEFDRARVRWFLSIDYDTLPVDVQKEGKRIFRSIKVDDVQIDFSEGFDDLHTLSYKHILNGTGFNIVDALPAIEMVHNIRTQHPIGLKGDYHPYAQKPVKAHPFKM